MGEMADYYNEQAKMEEAASMSKPDTMALHDLTSSPWCPKCGQLGRDHKSIVDLKRHTQLACHRSCEPALFTRLPASKPEELVRSTTETWMLRPDEHTEAVPISDAHAEKLCVGHWVLEYPQQASMVCTNGEITTKEVSREFVILLHRWLDSQESKP